MLDSTSGSLTVIATADPVGDTCGSASWRSLAMSSGTMNAGALVVSVMCRLSPLPEAQRGCANAPSTADGPYTLIRTPHTNIDLVPSVQGVRRDRGQDATWSMIAVRSVRAPRSTGSLDAATSWVTTGTVASISWSVLTHSADVSCTQNRVMPSEYSQKSSGSRSRTAAPARAVDPSMTSRYRAIAATLAGLDCGLNGLSGLAGSAACL